MSDTKHPLECNGPANIVMLIDERLSDRVTLYELRLLQQLKAEALATVAYMKQLEGHSPKSWSEIKKEVTQ